MVYEIMDTRVHALSQGIGEPVVVLHGWGSSRDVMKPVIDRLAQRFNVISLDFPGFGASQPPPFAWGVPEYAKMTVQLLDKMGLEKPVMLGHSFGGRVIIYAVGELLYEASRLVLVDSAGIKQPIQNKKSGFSTAKKLAKLLPQKQREAVLDGARQKYGSADYLAAEGVMREILVKTVNLDLAALLPKIENETLLIWGENDTATPLSDGVKMSVLLPNGKIEVLKSAAHYSFLDAPKDFFEVLDAWL